MILARIAAVFAGRNAKAKDFMMWPTEDKPELAPQNAMMVLQSAAAHNRKRKK